MNKEKEKSDELELRRLAVCYANASYEDKKVIWAILNKYVPALCAKGLL